MPAEHGEDAAVRLSVLALVMPFAAMSLGLGRTGKRAGLGLIGWARGSTVRAAFAATGAAAVLAGATYVLLPNGDYEPIRPGERGTIGEAVKSLPKTVGGRPSFTPEREAKYQAVPTEREQRTPLREEREPARGAPEREASGERDEPTTPAGEDRPSSDDGESPAPSTQGGSAAPGTAPAERTPSAEEPAATAEPTATATPTATPTPTTTPSATPTPTPEPAATP